MELRDGTHAAKHCSIAYQTIRRLGALKRILVKSLKEPTMPLKTLRPITFSVDLTPINIENVLTLHIKALRRHAIRSCRSSPTSKKLNLTYKRKRLEKKRT